MSPFKELTRGSFLHDHNMTERRRARGIGGGQSLFITARHPSSGEYAHAPYRGTSLMRTRHPP